MESGIRRLVWADALIGAACLIVMAPALCVGQADRETWQPPERIMDAVGVRPGMRVGEAGAGQGYFTFPLARRVGAEGFVLANDISTSRLDVIRQRAVREGLRNIKIVVGEVDNPLFPEKNLDMIVMVYVLHELERPIPFVKNLHSYLRPGGSLAIIERSTTVESTQSHSFMTNSRILATMSATGYELDRTETFLPRDTIYIYKAKRASLPAQDKTRAAAAASPASRKASFRGLGDFPGGAFESLAQRVSADGSVVVGNGTTASGKQAFRWTETQGMVSLGNLPDGSFKQSWAEGVSADGSVIVGYGDPTGSGWDGHKGFRWTKSGGMASIGSLNGSTRSEALAISSDGAVVVGDGGQQAFRWTESGGVVGLGVLPGRANSRAIAVSADGSVAVGSGYNLPSFEKEEAFLGTQAGGIEGLGYMPGGGGSFPNAISPEGSVIAGTASSATGSTAFRWTRSSGMVSIGHLPGRRLTHPGGVSANGSIIVGASFVDRDHATAFIWDAAHGMRSLESVLETEYGLDLAGWTLENAFGITPDGSVIVGWGKNPAGWREAFRAVLGAPSAR
jgi:probable HAF family extracellular repeat protein